MEIPRYWREMPVKVSFTGKEIGLDGTGRLAFKYPGGEIPLLGSFEEIYSRFEDKHFKPEVIEEILFYFFGAVASKPAISFEKIVNSQSEPVGGEVRKENRGKVKLGVDRLPRKISGRTLFSAGANN